MLGSHTLAEVPLSASEEQRREQLGAAAGGVVTLTGQVRLQSPSRGAGTGVIAFVSVGAMQIQSRGQAGKVLSLGGSAAARSTTAARVSADLSLDSQVAARLLVSVRSVPALAISGAAKARLPGMARSAGLVTLTRQGAGVIDVDASGARPLDITGQAGARAGTPARGAGRTDSLGHSEARSSSRGSASGGIVLTGAAVCSSVAPSFSEARGALDLAGAGQGAVASRVRLAGESPLHGDVSALLATQGRVSGQIAITHTGSGAVEIALVATRRLPLSGTRAARAVARVTAQPQATGILVLEGAARGIGYGLARSAAAVDLHAAGQGRVALSATGTGHLRIGTPGRGSAAIVGMTDSAFALTHSMRATTAGNAAGQGGLDCAGNAQAARPARGHVTRDLGLAGQSVVRQKIAAEAQGRVTVARAVLGDLAVRADSLRGLSLGGEGRARSAAAGRSTDLPLALAGSTLSQVASCAQGHAALELQGTSRAQAAIAVAVAPELAWRLQATVHTPRRAEGRRALSLLCVLLARAGITVGAGAAVLGLEGRQTGAVGLDARGLARAGLTGRSDVTSQVSGPAAGRLTITQASDAALQVRAAAARVIPLLGAVSAAISVQAERVDGALDLGGTAALQSGISARLRRDGHLLPAGHAQAAAALRAAGQSRVPFTRAGAGDVQVLGITLHGMTLLGAAAARARAQGHANLPVAPALGLSGATFVQAASQKAPFTSAGTFTGTVAVRAAARVLAWDLDMAAIAFRAPPALGRSEPPRQGLSGRLVPSNTGRILRG